MNSESPIIFCNTSIILEPLKLIGDGEYNINILTDIKVTESYLGLDRNVRKCQNEEPFFNCTTRKYIDSLLRECGCLPFNIFANKVLRILCLS